MIVAVVAGVAAADPHAVAEKTFQRGRALMKQHRYAEACVEFEQSQRLDPQLGTLFNLANCEAEIGKVASAWKIYRELEKSDPNPDRRALSGDLAKKLEKRLPKLLLSVPSRPAGLVVAIDKVDSTALLGVETPVDLGEHTIVATAPGFHESTETVVAQAGKVAKLAITLSPNDAEETPAVAASPVSAPAPAATHVERTDQPPIERETARGRYGKIAVIAGGGVTVAGLVLGAFAISKYHDAESCTACDKQAESSSAVVLGDISTASVVIGLAVVGGGIYLWRTSSSAAVVAPRVGADQVGVSLAGRF